MFVKWIRMLYLIVAWLFPVAILIQVFFVGLSLFTGQAYWSTHRDLGHSLAVLPLLLVILAYLGRLPSAEKRLIWLVLGVYLIQAEVFAAFRANVPLLAAFHPVLALVLFALALIIALRARTVVRAGVQTSSTSQDRPSMEEQESLAPD
jgi:membrane-bound metal-dependent hydrolase YbcI (DUF457 family)